MWLPLFVRKFGFNSVSEMIIYFVGNTLLLTIYWIVFAGYLKKKTENKSSILTMFPAYMFLFSGLLLRHWALVVFAILFGIVKFYAMQ